MALMIQITCSLFMILFVFISLAFLTLIERKILGFYQVRLGPGKTSVIGMIQPFSDALRLFIKMKLIISYAMGLVWVLSPLLSMLILLMNVLILPFGEGCMNFRSSLLILMVNFSLSIYFVLGRFYSGRKYRVLGMWRSLVQIMSYEVIFMFFLIFIFFHRRKLLLVGIEMGIFDFFLFIMLPLWILVIIIESGRIPFDIIERESELVSGFNTEYWGGGFAFVFIYEYGIIVFIRLITGMLFFTGLIVVFFFFVIMGFFIFSRGLFPRVRYDFVLIFSWKVFLPLGLLVSSVLLV